MYSYSKPFVACPTCAANGKYVPMKLLDPDVLLKLLSLGNEFPIFTCLHCGHTITVEAADPADEFEDWPF